MAYNLMRKENGIIKKGEKSPCFPKAKRGVMFL
jgi:hypothetical protein